MKMRGCSVLFVCALCVFVLCGAAVVFAQDVTPEKVAVEAANAMADTAKRKGDEALAIHKEYASNVSSVMSSLTSAIDKITACILEAGEMKRTEDLKKERILLEIDTLKTEAEAAKAAVEALRDVEADTLRDEQTKTKLTNRMKDVELYMMEVEKAEAAVTGNISTMDAVIEKAGALEAAAREASGLWRSAVWDLMIQLGSAVAAVSAVKTTITFTEGFLNFFDGSSDPEAQKVKKELSDIIESILRPSLEKLISLRDASEKAKMAAREATGKYRALAEKTKKLKEAAEDRRQRVQKVLKEGGQVSPDPLPSAAN